MLGVAPDQEAHDLRWVTDHLHALFRIALFAANNAPSALSHENCAISTCTISVYYFGDQHLTNILK